MLLTLRPCEHLYVGGTQREDSQRITQMDDCDIPQCIGIQCDMSPIHPLAFFTAAARSAAGCQGVAKRGRCAGCSSHPHAAALFCSGCSSLPHATALFCSGCSSHPHGAALFCSGGDSGEEIPMTYLSKNAQLHHCASLSPWKNIKIQKEKASFSRAVKPPSIP